MASAIDATKPVAGNPTTESVRQNFAAAKSEIELLQQTAGVGPQGPIGPTGPSGTLTVGTVITGPAGGSASVTNTGTTQAAVLNFTLPRGDSGTGGSGITETQAKDAVRQGNVTFLESPESTAVAFPTTPNLAQPPVVGANWTPTTGGTATQAYTHNIGSSDPLAYPATITSGTIYQLVFTITNVAATSTTQGPFVAAIYFRTGPTTGTGQQTVIQYLAGGMTVTVRATANFTHVVVVPESGWQGNFTMTRVVAFSGAQNSASLSVKTEWPVRVRSDSAYIGGGGRVATGEGNVSLGAGPPSISGGLSALAALTTGTYNTAVGFQALARVVSGGSNSAFGYQALAGVITGYNNIGIGSQAGLYLATGSTNIAIGDYAVYSYRSGNQSDNIAIGRYTQYWGSGSVSCNYNIAVGEWVGFRGSYNVGVGYCALAYTNGPPGETIGSFNVAVGNRAGSSYAGGNLYAADNSVFLGANTKAAADAETNQTVIGYNATGHGSNTITLGNDAITALHCHVQTISALSDSRVKEDIQPANLDKCLDAVKNLPVSRWAWQPIAGAHPDKHVTGFLADDVKKVWPKAVTAHDEFLPVLGSDGKPEMTSVTSPAWKPENTNEAAAAATPTTRLIEKTTEIKDLQYVSLTEALPTLWGAVQKLIQKNEELEKRLAEPQPSGEPAQPSEPKPSGESKPSRGEGLLRRHR